MSFRAERKRSTPAAEFAAIDRNPYCMGIGSIGLAALAAPEPSISIAHDGPLALAHVPPPLPPLRSVARVQPRRYGQTASVAKVLTPLRLGAAPPPQPEGLLVSRRNLRAVTELSVPEELEQPASHAAASAEGSENLPPVINRKAGKAPTLRAEGYTCRPSIDALAAMSDDELAAVENFTVVCSHGRITWPGKSDLRGLDLASIVRFEASTSPNPLVALGR